MSTIDKFLLAHLIIEAVFAIVYLLWQFDKIDIDDKAIQVVIALLNLFETILLILTRFIECGRVGTISLGIWYILNLILLVMQLSLTDWDRRFKVQNIVWILFYIIMFSNDIVHINLISAFFAKYGASLLKFGEAINGTIWGDIFKSVIIFIIKGVVNAFVTIKSDD